MFSLMYIVEVILLYICKLQDYKNPQKSHKCISFVYKYIVQVFRMPCLYKLYKNANNYC